MLLGRNQPDLVASRCEPDEVELWWAAASPLGVTLFESKALYVIPVMRQLAEGAILCLDDPREYRSSMELPAYVLIADAIETLGRCLTGCREGTTGSGKRLESGISRLLDHNQGPIATSAGTYNAKACKSLRNFTTHGGTTPVPGGDVLDGELTRGLINLLGVELTSYWECLKLDGEPLRDKLANALIRPLVADGRVVFVDDMYRFMDAPSAVAGAGISV
jgi:hypothetical protein